MRSTPLLSEETLIKLCDKVSHKSNHGDVVKRYPEAGFIKDVVETRLTRELSDTSDESAVSVFGTLSFKRNCFKH